MSRVSSLSHRARLAAACAVVGLMLGALAAWGGAQETTPPAKSDDLSASPTTSPKTAGKETKAAFKGPVYVGAYSVDHEFEFVTEECMEIIRSKKILFGSRSWGLQLGTIMARKDKKYELAWDPYTRPQVNYEERVLKADVFDKPKIVHYVFAPVRRRWAFFDDFLRKDPWTFGTKVDGAFQSLYCSGGKEAPQMAEEYFPMLEKLIKDFPKVKFAILTHPVSGEGPDMKGEYKAAASDWNIGGGDYSDALIRRYYGKVPILDIRDIVSCHADGKPCTFEHNGKVYRKLCPEYNVKGGDLIHPNTPVARERMAKGFILLLAKMFCADKLPPMDTPKPTSLVMPTPGGRQ